MSIATSTHKVLPAAMRAAFVAGLMIIGGGWAAAQVPEHLDLGRVADQEQVSHTLVVRNPRSDRTARVDLLAASEQLSVRPDTMLLGPGQSGTATVRYTAERYPWETGASVERSILVKSNLAELDNTRIRVSAELLETSSGTYSGCDACRRVEQSLDEEQRIARLERETLLVDYYYDPASKKSVDYLSRELPQAAKTAGKKLRILAKTVDDPAVRRELERRLEEDGRTPGRLPVLFIAHGVFQGLDAARAALPGELDR